MMTSSPSSSHQQNNNNKHLLDQTSGATISISVHKCGPASSWVGHNLLLRVKQFVLRDNTPSLSSSSSGADGADGGGYKNSSGVRFAFSDWQKSSSSSSSSSSTTNNANATNNNNDLDNKRRNMNLREMLAYCCNAVDSASFDPMSLAVAGSVPAKFRPPRFLTQVTNTKLLEDDDHHDDTKTKSKTGNVEEVEKNKIAAAGGQKQQLPCCETFPALFRWPYAPMSESDCKTCLNQTNGPGGLLSSKEEGKSNIVPEIKFQKTSAKTDKLPYSIEGDLTLVGKTRKVSCGAFLTPNAKEHDLMAVFQCPVDTREFGIPPASLLGLLKTEPEVLVEVAVPVHNLGL